ncbi:hypothetical protein GV828_04015 [Flavobacterium sp. NST-5]|uniref:Uncharacterized protein n=1 Tax=Flavobacterium ichthyis TaxID=2698827 RepID=A0ABW9Z688_9FLAO|nr:hypothetical protein [Flavobacterium ichthyis]NBL64367.1 hypothetical protein [Flavobacterium ichthyis]
MKHLEDKNLREKSASEKESEALIEQYKLNDEAFRKSSKEDFVETVSKFHHEDERKSTDKKQ